MTYQRPVLQIRDFLDGQGIVIPYGDRWGDESPPADKYSVESHPERFAPILVVANALIDYLVRTYDVAVERMNSSISLTPLGGGAPLRFEIDDASYTVRLSAGAWARYWFPFCGCDACDDSVEDLMNDLEASAFGIVDGGLAEHVEGNRRVVALTTADGWSSSEIKIARSELKRIHAQARDIPVVGWSAWRVAGSSESDS